MLAALAGAMDRRLAQWARGEGFAAIRADWLKRAAGLGQEIRVRLPEREFSGLFEGLDDAGRLLVQQAGVRDAGHRRRSIRFREFHAMTQGAQELVFAPLGGVGEIGMNLAIYGLGDERRRQWLAVDCGVSFAAEEHLPGVDLILPDIRFLEEERKNLAGIVLTHAHEDHFGALLELWPKLKVPVYATPFSAALLRAKCAGEPGAPDIPVTIVECGSRFQVGPFDIELVTMAHSIPESNALIIRTPRGTVLHTGDWKIDRDAGPQRSAPTRRNCVRLGEEGCLALIGDSTNAVRDGTSPSESDVARVLTELIKSAPRRVAVTTFASNVARLRAVADAARAAGREVVVVGRAMERIVAHRARDRPFRRRAGFPLHRRLRLSADRTRWWRCAPAARASRARRSRASPRTSIRT